MLYTHVNLRPLMGEEVSEVELPSGVRDKEGDDEEIEDEKEEDCEQIGDLATMSGLPSSRYSTRSQFINKGSRGIRKTPTFDFFNFQKKTS